MIVLYLCEKPSQAKDIARVLSANQRRDGYFAGTSVIVTWCFGHLLEMASPEDYDSELKSWRLETLPIIPGRWLWKVRKDAKKQCDIIVSLFKQAGEIVISTDADREGEAIAREVMELGGWQGPVSRLWLSALDDKSIRHALANRLPGTQTEALYQAAAARSKADWLVGMNLSRLYTLSARQAVHDGVMSVGRVQTPTLKLVVDRDRLIEGFKPVPYFDVLATFQKQQGQVCFAGQWQAPEEMADAEGRCLKRSAAQTVVDQCQSKTATVVSAATQRMKVSPPLLFSLSSLQLEASKRFGMGAQVVLDGAQALYESHKLTTYPRTDCEYLPQSHYESAEAILKVLNNDDEFRILAERADAGLRSKAWNDQKITAHHAIVPTGVRRTMTLSDNVKKLYDLIVRRYLSQFYPDHEYEQTTLVIDVGEDRFKATGKRVIVSGWKKVWCNSDDEKSDKTLPKIVEGESLNLVEAQVEAKQTQPPARYTEGSLIQAMKTIGKAVENPVLKQRLKETAGIGTEATRAAIIEVLFKRSFIVKQKKHLVSTEQARALIDALPDPVKDPATTAVWEQALENIAEGHGDADRFVEQQAQLVRHLTERGKQEPSTVFKGASTGTQRYTCPECEHPLVRRKNQHGYFWGCRNYPECKAILPDDNGKPGKAKSKPASTGQRCPECEKGELLSRTVRKGKSKGKTFLGCNRFPACRYTEG